MKSALVAGRDIAPSSASTTIMAARCCGVREHAGPAVAFMCRAIARAGYSLASTTRSCRAKRDGGVTRSPISPASARCAGGTTAENACAAAAALLMLPEPLDGRTDRSGRMTSLSGSAASHGGARAAAAARCSSTTARRRTPTSAEKALLSFPRDVYWILGGKPKAGGIASLAALFRARHQGLPDRRGDGGIRRHARWPGSIRALRHAR